MAILELLKSLKQILCKLFINRVKVYVVDACQNHGHTCFACTPSPCVC